MKRKCLGVLGLLLALAGLQQGLHRLCRIPPLDRQMELIRRRDFQPAAFFYTESPDAMRAEKSVRVKLANGSR